MAPRPSPRPPLVLGASGPCTTAPGSRHAFAWGRASRCPSSRSCSARKPEHGDRDRLTAEPILSGASQARVLDVASTRAAAEAPAIAQPVSDKRGHQIEADDVVRGGAYGQPEGRRRIGHLGRPASQPATAAFTLPGRRRSLLHSRDSKRRARPDPWRRGEERAGTSALPESARRELGGIRPPLAVAFAQCRARRRPPESRRPSGPVGGRCIGTAGSSTPSRTPCYRRQARLGPTTGRLLPRPVARPAGTPASRRRPPPRAVTARLCCRPLPGVPEPAAADGPDFCICHSVDLSGASGLHASRFRCRCAR
jgi:hypothetical protein